MGGTNCKITLQGCENREEGKLVKFSQFTQCMYVCVHVCTHMKTKSIYNYTFWILSPDNAADPSC